MKIIFKIFPMFLLVSVSLFIVSCSQEEEKVVEITQEAVVESRTTCEDLGVTECCDAGFVLQDFAALLQAEQVNPEGTSNSELWDSWRILSCAISICNQVGVECTGYEQNGNCETLADTDPVGNSLIDRINNSPFLPNPDKESAIELNLLYCTLNCYLREYVSNPSAGLDGVLCAFNDLLQGFHEPVGTEGTSLVTRLIDDRGCDVDVDGEFEIFDDITGYGIDKPDGGCCNDDCSIEIVLVNSGTDCYIQVSSVDCNKPLSFLWTYPSGATTDYFRIGAQALGEYCVEITDADGCTFNDCIIIDDNSCQ